MYGRPPGLTFDLQLKTGLPVTSAVRNVHTNLLFSTPFSILVFFREAVPHNKYACNFVLSLLSLLYRTGDAVV